MEKDWRAALKKDYESVVAVRSEPLRSALRQIRIAVPEMVLSTDEGGVEVLGWRTEAINISEPLDTCFWEFIALDHADDVQLIQFARRFGPLTSIEGIALPNEQSSVAQVRSQDAGSPDRESASGNQILEPLWAWRMCARGLAALYDWADPGLPPTELDATTRVWARAPFVVAHWLRQAQLDAPPPEFGSLASLGMRTELDSDHQGVDWIVSNTLRTAGVGPAYDVDAQRTGSGYTLAAQPPGSAGTYLTWGLLPVLVASLAIAAQTQERPRCTFCKKPAAITHRGPRAGRPWYGDHLMCRALARAETMVRAEDKRAEKRRSQLREHAEPTRDSPVQLTAAVDQR